MKENNNIKVGKIESMSNGMEFFPISQIPSIYFIKKKENGWERILYPSASYTQSNLLSFAKNQTSHPWIEPIIGAEYDEGVRVITAWNFEDIVANSP